MEKTMNLKGSCNGELTSGQAGSIGTYILKHFLFAVLALTLILLVSSCAEADPHELCETYADQVSWIPSIPHADLSASMTAEDLASRNPNVCRIAVTDVDDSVNEVAEMLDGFIDVKIFFTVENAADAEKVGMTFFTFAAIPEKMSPDSLIGAKYVSVLNLSQNTKGAFLFNPYWTFYINENGKLVNPFGCRYEEEHFEEFEQYNLSIPARLFTGRTEKDLTDALSPKTED